jgi:hypothetical protein
MKKGMTNGTMEKLQKKLQNTVAIMMDERSIMSPRFGWTGGG